MNLDTCSPLIRDEAKRLGIGQSKTAETLSWITRDGLPLYLNVNTYGKGRSYDGFTGATAECDAREDAKDRGEHLTTIVLHPNGTWTEKYLGAL